MDQQFLLSTVVGDGILVIGLVYVMMAPKRQESTLEQIDDVELRTPPSTLMRTYFLVFGTMFSLFTGAIIYFRFSGDPEVGLGAVFGGPDPLVSNSLTKYGTLAAIAWVLFRKPSLRKYFIPTMVTAFTFSLVATIAYGFQGSTMLISRLGTTVTLPWFMMNHVVVDGGGILLLLGVRWLQYHVDFQIASLRPSSAECVIALNQAFREERLRPEKAWRDVLKGIDEYIVSMRGRRRGLVSFPFWLLEHVFPFVCSFRPPFSTMSRTEGRWFLRRHVLRPIYERQTALVPAMADLMYQMGDIAHGLVTFSYYGTDHAHDQIGYIRADARARLQTEVATEAPPTKTEILQYPRDHRDPIGWRPISESSRTSKILAPRLGSPLHPDSIPREVDYCIIGSGAAGGVLAYRLGKEKGGADSICVLERGGSYGPRRDFSENEMKMISMLYTEGGLQVTRSFDFTILQAECVGGTTVVNNAVCFRMPEETASEWSNFGIDTAALSSHYDSIAAEINISPVIDESVNSSAQKLFVEGVRKYNASLRSADKLSPVQKNLGNFTNCLGCGQCNIGCRYMRKLSALETYVPWAQAHGVSVIRSVGAVQCETEQRGEKKVVNAVIVRDANGSFQRIRIRKALIVSAGAIASSRFLMRSGVGGEGVGRFLSCNFAIPPLVTFENPVNAFDGVQMPLHALSDYGEAIYETSFNMPGSYAISFPLYFDPHAGMMDSYAKSVNFTALVWSDPAGSVSLKRDVLFGRAIQWDQTPNDLLRIKRALATIIRVAREAGAKRVILPTLPPVEVPMDAFVEERIKDMERVINHKKYINFITAHPQGGNMMAADTFNERVADLDFRVRGCENLFVCDASVFPRGVRVNPQWTIMALASKASGHIMSLT